MSINNNYIATTSLDEYFVDKTTGLPLTNGQIYFWQDVNRANPKAIYTISGSPPNYSFVPLPNPLSLSAVGTPEDGSGNNVVIYYYPFDDEGNVDLYYIEVFDSNGSSQFTREGWPPDVAVAETPSAGIAIINYIPNGQFLAHNNIAANPIARTIAGQITKPITDIAQGGWTFERPMVSTAIDYVNFFRYAAYVANPTGSPRYAVQISCTNPNPADTFKNLSLSFQDVNKFSSDTQAYTLGFSAVTSGSANFSVQLNIVKNFGTGGSLPITIPVTTLTITNVVQFFVITLNFGNNAGYTIGPNDDDFVQLAFTLPTNVAFNGIFTDFVLTPDVVQLTAFPTTTNDQFMVNALAPPPNDYNGYDIGLPLILTQEGLTYDQSSVGQVTSYVNEIAPFGWLNCDGSQYTTSAYSSDGIPYARLQKKLMGQITPSKFVFIPIFGTGPTYVTSYLAVGSNNQILLSTNQPGIQTLPSDGLIPTGFTFTTNFFGQTNIGFQGSLYGDLTTVWALNNLIGDAVAPPNPGTSGLIINLTPDVTDGEKLGDFNTQQLVSIGVVALPGAGTYFKLSTSSFTYRFWFTIDGVGTNPGGSGIPVKINLLSTMSIQDVALAIMQILNSVQLVNIQFGAGSTITNGSYFTFYANSQLYYVWYTTGSGIDPSLANGIGIPVGYNSGYTANQVRDATAFSINFVYFCVPFTPGLVIKGYDSTGTVDVNSKYRNASNPYVLNPPYIGSGQYDFLLGHTHSIQDYPNTGVGANTLNPVLQNGVPTTIYTNINETGTGQNDVKNLYLNFIIKY